MAAGRIRIVGLGPGAGEQMTQQAVRAVRESRVITGYTVYVDLLRDTYPDKEYITTPMRQEIDRCRMAFERAAGGDEVAMVCSGDAGVYGMAGLMYELSDDYPQVELEVIPGITAATGGAAVLGAPLMHDFAVISLSDLLTPWEKIEKRLLACSMADMVICLYNPSSKKRADYLARACRIMMEHKSPDTICGIVSRIGREGETWKTMTLGELAHEKTDMFTTVYVGNEQTRLIRGRMVTPRGYESKSGYGPKKEQL